jgi:hypothetical protein
LKHSVLFNVLNHANAAGANAAGIARSLAWDSRRKVLRRKISLLVTLALLSGLALISHGCSRSEATGEINDTFAPDLNDSKLKERLADDDGYSFAVMYGSDVHGSLETCG